MGRIIAFDVGIKRTGIAQTDPLKIIASPYDTLPTHEIIPWLKKYSSSEEVEAVVVGMPLDDNLRETDSTHKVQKLVNRLKNEFGKLAVYTLDERYTTKLATKALIEGGLKKGKRKEKNHVDKVSAAIILQSFLEQQNDL